jgi:hypothetical protein
VGGGVAESSCVLLYDFDGGGNHMASLFSLEVRFRVSFLVMLVGFHFPDF